MATLRLDQLVVERGLCGSREQARRCIVAGQVRWKDQRAIKPSQRCRPDDAVDLIRPPRFVSRGGEKLEGAFEAFGLQVAGLTGIDIGASTGGFTDCLLQHGAARVYAVDVGRGQLAYTLQQDERVVVMDRTNARHLTGADFPEPLAFCVIDASFISLTKILPAVHSLLKPGGFTVALIKPQFEAGRSQVGKGGVVRDPAVHERVIAEIRAFIEGELGWHWRGVTPSPIKGPAGNVEFTALMTKP